MGLVLLAARRPPYVPPPQASTPTGPMRRYHDHHHCLDSAACSANLPVPNPTGHVQHLEPKELPKTAFPRWL